jgi:hypothetical protein
MTISLWCCLVRCFGAVIWLQCDPIWLHTFVSLAL